MLSLLYGPTLTSTLLGKNKQTNKQNIVLTIWTSVCNVSVFNMLSRLVIAFLPRNKHLSISWLQSPSAVILEPTVSPSICHEVMGPDAMILVF